MLEVPDGCMEIPGVILVIEPGKRWITQDGQITENWKDRGVWESEADANKFLEDITNDA